MNPVGSVGSNAPASFACSIRFAVSWTSSSLSPSTTGVLVGLSGTLTPGGRPCGQRCSRMSLTHALSTGLSGPPHMGSAGWGPKHTLPLHCPPFSWQRQETGDHAHWRNERSEIQTSDKHVNTKDRIPLYGKKNHKIFSKRSPSTAIWEPPNCGRPRTEFAALPNKHLAGCIFTVAVAVAMTVPVPMPMPVPGLLATLMVRRLGLLEHEAGAHAPHAGRQPSHAGHSLEDLTPVQKRVESSKQTG